jgi:uncharacterized protein YcfJ
MNHSLVKGLVIGGIAATAVGAAAGYKAIVARPAYAQVLAVDPVTKSVRTPRQSCHDEAVTRQVPVKDTNRIAGTVVGAVLGGVLGNQLGHGSAHGIVTVAGAAAGGYAGNKVQQRMQQGDTYQAQERRCTTVYDVVQQPAGYRVRYKLHDREGTVHMDHDPGDRIPVKDGRLVLADSTRRT